MRPAVQASGRRDGQAGFRVRSWVRAVEVPVIWGVRACTAVLGRWCPLMSLGPRMWYPTTFNGATAMGRCYVGLRLGAGHQTRRGPAPAIRTMALTGTPARAHCGPAQDHGNTTMRSVHRDPYLAVLCQKPRGGRPPIGAEQVRCTAAAHAAGARQRTGKEA